MISATKHERASALSLAAAEILTTATDRATEFAAEIEEALEALERGEVLEALGGAATFAASIDALERMCTTANELLLAARDVGGAA